VGATVVFVLVLAAMLGLLAGVHRYLWQRLVRDTTTQGGWGRRTGTAAAFVLPLTSLGALVGGRAGAPFPVQQTLAWPGYLWLALVLYLTLALLVGEAVRPLLLRVLPARAAGPTPSPTPSPAPAPAGRLPAGQAGQAGRVSAVVGAPALDRAAVAAVGGSGGPRVTASGSGSGSGSDSGTGTGTGTDDSSPTQQEPAAPRTPLGALARAVLPAEERHTAGNATMLGGEAPPEAADRPRTEAGCAGGRNTGTGSAVAGRTDGPATFTRRLFVARTVAVAASVAAAGTVAYGTREVLNGPTVKRVRVRLAKLPRSADGYRIAVASDIHLGPVLGRAHTQRIVDAINRTRPDLVAIVGDLVDGSVADLRPAAAPLARLRSRHGSYFVTGNHEYFSGAAEWIDHLRDLGVHPLENARVALPGFDLAGVNDVSAARQDPALGPDYDRALRGRDPARAVVLLAHQPVAVHEAVRHGVDLQLSGHTHGGQLWPGHYLAALANPTVAGLEHYGDTQLYVSRGAGAWGPPVRVGAEPDITVLTLESGAV
jgi:predicted MPP superfamily phosphohydrolase